MKMKNVQQWLQSSQRDLPYELDFFTPFKDMVVPEKPTHQNRHASKRKHTHPKSSNLESPIIISSEEDKSSSSSTSSASSSQKYKRRPRHKTREDRYEYKGSKRRAANKHRESSAEHPKEYKKQKKRVKKDVVENFTARNVLSDRLTLNKPGGIFQRGRASIPASRPALPDLKFSEQAFLNLKRKDGIRRDENEKESRNAGARRLEQNDKRQQEQEARISEYFRQLPPVRHAKDTAQTHAGADAATHRPNIFQTPCPQRQASPELSSPPLIDVPLPGPAFLGFGEKGPPPASKSSLRRTASLTPISEHYQHGNKTHRERIVPADLEPASEFSLQDDTTATCTPDPRAKHSATSNFAFAKGQQAQKQRSNVLHTRRERSRHDDQIRQPDRQEEIIELLRELRNRQASENVAKIRLSASEQSDISKQKSRLSSEQEAHELVEMLMDSSKVMNGGTREKTLHNLSQIIESIQNEGDKDAAGRANSTEATKTSGQQFDKSASEANDDSANAPHAQVQFTLDGPRSESQGEKVLSQGKVDPKLAPALEPEISTPGPVNEIHARSNTAMHNPSDREPPSRPENPHDMHQHFSNHDCNSLPTPSSLNQLPVHGGAQSRAGYTSPSMLSRPRIIQIAHSPGLYEQQTRGFAHQGFTFSLTTSRPGTSSSMRRPISRMRPHLFGDLRHGLRRTSMSPHQEWIHTSEMLSASHNAYQGSYTDFAPAQSEHPRALEGTSPARTCHEDVQMTGAGLCNQTPSFAEVESIEGLQYRPYSVDGLSSAGYRFLDESDHAQPQTDSMTTFSDVHETDMQLKYPKGSADMPNFWRPNVLY